jgi:hyperosmotically inducible periplasmic protein
MKRIPSAAAAASALAVLLSLTACGQRMPEETMGQQFDSPVDRTAAAANRANEDAREQAARAAENAKRATASSRDASSTAMMGAPGDVPPAASPVPPAGVTPTDDAQITSRVSASIMGDKELNKVRIDVDTRDGVVTLSGPVPSSTIKARANEVAKAVKDVKAVNNQLTVSAS